MEVVAQVKRIVALLDRAVEPVYDGTEVTAAEVELLVPLRYADEPITASRLAARLGMSRAGVSKALAKLERRGYRNAVYDTDEQLWICEAAVAEVPFTAFTGRPNRGTSHRPADRATGSAASAWAWCSPIVSSA